MSIKNNIREILEAYEEDDSLNNSTKELFDDEVQYDDENMEVIRKEPYIPFYDEEMDVWSVKDIRDNVCYPMTGENMANEITNLLNHYTCSLYKVSDELYKKDRNFEELGYDLDELDKY